MKEYLLYALTFMVVVLPTVYYLFLQDRSPKRQKIKNPYKLPPVFLYTESIANILMDMHLGELFRLILPGHSKTLQDNLVFSGLKIKIEKVYCTQILLSVLLGGLGLVGGLLVLDPEDWKGAFIAGIIFALCGWSIPEIIIGNLAQDRRTKILQALPYSIDLIASAMRGGLDFSAAIRFYVNIGISSPLIDEYSQMLREMELGVIRLEALQNMADRLQIKEFTSFTSAIIIGTELGAPLAETMVTQGEEMRKARFALAECKAQRAPSLMLLPMALFILPAVFIVIFVPVYIKMKESGI